MSAISARIMATDAAFEAIRNSFSAHGMQRESSSPVYVISPSAIRTKCHLKVSSARSGSGKPASDGVREINSPAAARSLHRSCRLRHAVARASLVDDGIEERIAVAQRDPPLAIRRAAVGAPLDAAIERVLLFAMVASKGASGVTGTGFVTLAAILATVPEIPIQALALLVGIDKFMSECRALTNVVGNGVATIVVSQWEGELDTEKMHEAMSGATAKAE